MTKPMTLTRWSALVGILATLATGAVWGSVTFFGWVASSAELKREEMQRVANDQAEAVVRAEAHGLVRHFPVGPAVDGQRRVTVKWPATKRIEADFGRRFDLSLRHAVGIQAATGVLETHVSGRVMLVVRDTALGEQEIPVEVPDRPGAVVRVPANALLAPGRLRVTCTDGTPFAKTWLRINGELERLDENGRVVSWRVKDGAAILARREGHVSLRRTLAGGGPHELRWGAGRLDLDVTGPAGFTAYVNGDLFNAEGPRLTVVGLDAGPHTVIVAAEGHEGRVFRVTLGEGETRAVSVALPKRP